MAESDDRAVLPPSLELLWGRREVGRRGPKPGLNVDAIVAAAVEIANAEGLDAVSMARVAKAVGFTTMSLYRYVTNKDELLQLMWNASADGVMEFELEGETWRSRLLSWAMAQREAIARNIWIVQMPMATPPLAPNSLRWMEVGLEALGDTELGDGEKMRVLGLISSHALIDARMAYDAQQAKGAGAVPIDYTAILREVAEEERFPHLHRVAWSGEADDPEPGDDPFAEYRFDLEVMLDGIEALVERSRS
ncbi:TetR/AcrR family transcriptional regulator [Aeromicrobium ginsengisoli]|nr:TetR/AcrR family transcriptional regulator [Aeromicrobium ginsengisoli]